MEALKINQRHERISETFIQKKPQNIQIWNFHLSNCACQRAGVQKKMHWTECYFLAIIMTNVK